MEGVTEQELAIYQKVADAKEKAVFDAETKLIEAVNGKRPLAEGEKDATEEPPMKKARTAPVEKQALILAQVHRVLDLFLREQHIFKTNRAFRHLWSSIESAKSNTDECAGLYARAYATAAEWEAFLAIPLAEALSDEKNKKTIAELVPDYKKWLSRLLVVFADWGSTSAIQFLLAVINNSAMPDADDDSFIRTFIEVVLTELEDRVKARLGSHSLKVIATCLFTKMPTTYMRFHVIKKTLADGTPYDEHAFEMLDLYGYGLDRAFALDLVGNTPTLLEVLEKCRAIATKRTWDKPLF
jgi:hypothetical protein